MKLEAILYPKFLQILTKQTSTDSRAKKLINLIPFLLNLIPLFYEPSIERVGKGFYTTFCLYFLKPFCRVNEGEKERKGQPSETLLHIPGKSSKNVRNNCLCTDNYGICFRILADNDISFHRNLHRPQNLYLHLRLHAAPTPFIGQVPEALSLPANARHARNSTDTGEPVAVVTEHRFLFLSLNVRIYFFIIYVVALRILVNVRPCYLASVVYEIDENPYNESRMAMTTPINSNVQRLTRYFDSLSVIPTEPHILHCYNDGSPTITYLASGEVMIES